MSSLFAFNLAEEISSVEVIGSYDADKQLWVGNNNVTAVSSSGSSVSTGTSGTGSTSQVYSYSTFRNGQSDSGQSVFTDGDPGDGYTDSDPD